MLAHPHSAESLDIGTRPWRTVSNKLSAGGDRNFVRGLHPSRTVRRGAKLRGLRCGGPRLRDLRPPTRDGVQPCGDTRRLRRQFRPRVQGCLYWDIPLQSRREPELQLPRLLIARQARARRENSPSILEGSLPLAPTTCRGTHVHPNRLVDPTSVLGATRLWRSYRARPLPRTFTPSTTAHDHQPRYPPDG